MVSISACHAEDPGSIPGRGVFCFFLSFFFLSVFDIWWLISLSVMRAEPGFDSQAGSIFPPPILPHPFFPILPFQYILHSPRSFFPFSIFSPFYSPFFSPFFYHLLFFFVQVCDDSLHSVRCHDQGKLLACGSHSGDITLLEMSDFICSSQPNEKQNTNAVSSSLSLFLCF